MLVGKSNLAQLRLSVGQSLINNPAMLVLPEQAQIQHINRAKRGNPQLSHLQDSIAVPEIIVQILLRPIRAETHHAAILILNPVKMIQPPPAIGQQLLPIRSCIRRLRHSTSTAKNSRGRSPETRMPNRAPRLQREPVSTSCHPRSIIRVLPSLSQAAPSLETSTPDGSVSEAKTRAQMRPAYPCPNSPPHPAH